jgi:hypothetical protein
MRRWLVVLVAAMVIAFPARAFAGYTHYWTWLKRPEPAKLAVCLDDMEKVLRARPDLVADDDERTGPSAKFRIVPPHPSDDVAMRMQEAGLPPLLDGEHIVFNGIGDDAHEDFRFPGALGFNFTKTQWKPYDEVVTAALIVARAHFSVEELEIKSDGDWEAWTPGRRLYEKTFARPAPNALVATSQQAPNERASWIISASVLGLGIVAWLVMRTRRR